MNDHVDHDELEAALRNAKKRAVALSYQFDLMIDQLSQLHNKLCNLAMILNAIVDVGFGFEGEGRGTDERVCADRRPDDDPQ